MSWIDGAQTGNRRQALLVFAASFFLHTWILWGPGLGLVAEGVSYTAAQRILDGEVPYRDYWTVYAPGSAYLLAGVFQLFGSQIIVARLTSAVLYSLSGLAVYGIAARVVAGRLAVLIALVVSISLSPASHYYGTYSPVLPSLLLALFAATSYFHGRRVRWLLLAGVGCSLAVVFKHDVGGYVSLSILAALLLRRLAPDGNRESLGRELRYFLGGCATVAVPVYGALLAVAARDLWIDLVHFPLTDFPASRPEEYPGLVPDPSQLRSPVDAIREITLRLRHWIPAAVFLGSAAWLLTRGRRASAGRFATQLLLTLCLPFFWNAAHVQVNTHIFSMTVLSALILGMHLGDLRARPGRGRGSTAIAGLIAAVCIAGWWEVPAEIAAFKRFRDGLGVPLGFPRGAVIRTNAGFARDLQALKEAVDARSGPDDPIFVGLHRHDAVVVNSPLVYFLFERPIPVRYHELHTAVADTEPVQQEMIADLEQKNVKIAILWERFEDENLEKALVERRDELPDRGAHALDEYLRQNFEFVEKFGYYQLWQRRQAPAAEVSLDG